MGTIKMKDKTAEAVSNLDAQILKNVEIAEKEQAKNAKWEESTLAGALYEEKSLRGENTKLWRMNDGTMRQIISPNAIHYRDANGELQEIDNTLVEDESAYQAVNGANKVELSKDASGKLMKITSGEAELSWIYCKTETAEKSKAKLRRIAAERNVVAEKTNGGVIYENVENGVDIEYELCGRGVKENIKVREKREEYRFEFALNAKGYRVKLSEDGRSIELYRGDKREYIIPEPYMYDESGARNDEVYYEMEKEGEEEYRFTVVAEPEWINAADRAMPVTIDPQIITSESFLYTAKTLLSTCSGYGWTPQNTNYMRVSNYDYCKTYKTEITINRKNFPLCDQKIISAYMILTPYSVNGSGDILIGGTRNKVYSGAALKFNVISAFKSTRDTYTIEITAAGRTDVTFYKDGVNAPAFEIEYLMNEEIKPCKRKIDILGNVMGTFDVATGELVTEFTDVAACDSVAGLEISHICKQSVSDYNCGADFRLNLNESLINNGIEGSDANYIYIDAYGDKYGFKEYFYYLDENNRKVYVSDKSGITVEADGSLNYYGRKVIREELSASGWKAVTELKGFINNELYENRQDEIKQLEEQITSYYNALKDYVVMDMNTGDIVEKCNSEVVMGNLSLAHYDNVMQELENASRMALPRIEAAQYKSLKSQYEALTSNCEGCADIVPGAKKIKKQIIALESAYYEINNVLNHYADKYVGFMLGALLHNGKEILNCIKNKLPFRMEIIQNSFLDDYQYNEYFLDEDAGSLKKEVQPKVNGLTLKSQMRQRNLYLEQLSQQYEELERQTNLVREQMFGITDKCETNTKMLKQYYKEYHNKKEELIVRRRHLPVRYLTNGEIIKAYNSEGRLIVVSDTYENVAAIELDEYNRIMRVYDKNNNDINFTYNFNGKLASITDTRGRITRYIYDEKRLAQIEYPNGGILTLTYKNEKIESIAEGKRNKKVRLSYTGTQCSEIAQYSGAQTITHGAYTKGEKEQGRIEIEYNSNETEINTYGEKRTRETYKFNSVGNVTAYYSEEKRGTRFEVTQGEKYSYKKYSHNKTRYAEKSKLNKPCDNLDALIADYPAVGSEDMYNGEYTYITLNDFNNPVTEETGWTTIGYDENSTPTKQKTLTTYEYDDNHRAVKEITDATTKYANKETTIRSVKTYAYNSQGSVVRTESYVEKEDDDNFVLDMSLGETIEETVYDEKGRTVKSFKYNSLDSSSKFYTESEYAEDGKVTAEIDETGENKTRLEYIDGTETVRTKILPNGSKFGYGHDVNDTVTAITQSTESGEENSTQTAYTCGEVTELRSGNNVVRYEYDYKRRKTAVDLNDTKDYVTYKYSADGKTTTAKYTERTCGNTKVTDTFETVTDERGRVTSTKYNNETQVSIEYNDAERKEIHICKTGAENVTTEIAYDSLDRIDFVKTNNVQTEKYTYNSDGQLTTKTLTVDGINTVYEYGYKDNAAKDLKYVKLGNIASSPKSDCLGRNIGKELCRVTQENEEDKLTPFAAEYITYRKHGDHATNMPSAERYGEMRDGQFVLLDNLKYKYDTCGNISEVWENGKLAAKYTYDKLNRLVREDNKQLGKTTLFAYDNNGNILSKREFAFTLKDTALLEELTETLYLQYAYDGDKLLSFGAENFIYDALGNPTTYRGKLCAWEKGRQLVSYDGNTFAYDGQGRRISKTANGVTTHFTYDSNGNLIKQSDGTNTLEFLYDNSGVMGVKYGNATYYYRKNVQGDVIAILDSTGKVMVQYNYDAWGNHAVLDPNGGDLTSATNIANLNPFRYRGYYYDVETGLYYLQTRCYDPETGRFITIDDLSYLDTEHINGLNLYAYCANNPIMAIDPEGTKLKWWQKLLIGLAFVVVGAIVTAVTAGTGAGFMATFGAALVTSLKAVAISTVISAGIGMVIGGITTGTWQGALDGMINGAVDGFMWGGIFAGGAQILSGAMKITRNVASGFNGLKIGKVKLWSPNSATNPNIGGTLLKLGKFNRIDVEIGQLLHVHLKILGHNFNHLPLGTILAGIIGGLRKKK